MQIKDNDNRKGSTGEIARNRAEQWHERAGVCSESANEALGRGGGSHIELLAEGLSSQRYDDYERRPRYHQEKVGNIIIENAKANGLFIPLEKTRLLGERYEKSSGESIVYLNEGEDRIYKVKDPFAKYPIKCHEVSDVLYEHILHNRLFPNAQYTLEAVSDDIGDLRLVFSQPYIRASFEPATQAQIDDFLINHLGLVKENQYYYGNEDFSITDVGAAGDNVLADNNGNLYFIDPIIKFKKSASEIIRGMAANK